MLSVSFSVAVSFSIATSITFYHDFFGAFVLNLVNVVIHVWCAAVIVVNDKRAASGWNVIAVNTGQTAGTYPPPVSYVDVFGSADVVVRIYVGQIVIFNTGRGYRRPNRRRSHVDIYRNLPCESQQPSRKTADRIDFFIVIQVWYKLLENPGAACYSRILKIYKIIRLIVWA